MLVVSHYSSSVTIRQVRRETSLIAQDWLHSSQAFDNPLWSSDLLLGYGEGLGHEGVVIHLGVAAHLNSLLSV
jgi:hypothetical protein